MLGKGNIAGLMEKMKQADVDLEKQARRGRDVGEIWARYEGDAGEGERR